MKDFKDIIAVSDFLSGFRKPWFIAGGWALDLYLNKKTRAHKDIDIVILRRDQHFLQEYMKGWTVKKVIPESDGGYMEDWIEGELLEHPVHEIHAYRVSKKPSNLEFLLEETSGEEWRFRRNPAIEMPISKISMISNNGIPFLIPEIVLLYKSTDKNSHDQGFVDKVLEMLNTAARDWLRSAIEKCHPEHPWLTNIL
jgi:hypothetical protein